MVGNIFPQGFLDPATGAYVNCQQSIHISDPSLGVAHPTLSLADGSAVWEGPHPFDSARYGRHLTTVAYWYATAPASVTGHCASRTADIHLLAGWNAVTIDGDHEPERVWTVPGQQFGFFLDSLTPTTAAP